ncbi:MAG: hypothetical protein QW171_04155 [Candidatus Bilamarchaeaceae archaeon]
MRELRWCVIASALLFLCSVSSAGWLELAAGATMLSVILIAVVYAIGIGFDVNELKVLAKEELFQLLVVVILIIGLLGADGVLNAISGSAEFARGEPTLQDAAAKSLNETLNNLSTCLEKVASMDKASSMEASRSDSCIIAGGGYGVSACGGYSMLTTPLGMAGSIISFAIAEISSVQKIISVSKQFALSLLLPFGILLRTFRFTRGAGGFLIALGIALYILVPLGIVFVDMLCDKFDYVVHSDPNAHSSLKASSIYFEEPANVNIKECEAGRTWIDVGKSAVDSFNNMRGELKKYVYIVLIKGTLGPLLSLLLFITGLRALTVVFGAPVDVSAIARFF